MQQLTIGCTGKVDKSQVDMTHEYQCEVFAELSRNIFRIQISNFLFFHKKLYTLNDYYREYTENITQRC